MTKLNHSRSIGILLALGLGVALAACQPSAVSEVLGSASELIGPEGGTLRVGDTEVVIPRGALSTSTRIQMDVSARAVPGIFERYSPVIHFEPEGIALAIPAEMRIPFQGDARLASAFAGVTQGEAFAAMPTSIEDGRAISSMLQLSTAFVGSACGGEGCCDPANGELDVLLVVDNSGSMGEEQALLVREFPRLARVLASGDRDGDGIQDFPALQSVQLGVISTDLGSGAEAGVRTCEPGFGQDGILLGSPGSSFATYNAADPASLEDFVAHVSSTAMLGTAGCGYEQPLEASLLALSAPSTMPASPIGYEGRTGHALGANAGFLRDNSMLAIVYVTDENDMSVADAAVFSGSDARFASVPPNQRAFVLEDDTSAILPVSRYVSNMSALRDDPRDLIFAAVTGIPMDVSPDAANPDFAALDASTDMTFRSDESGSSALPACSSMNGVAQPSRRIVHTAEGLEAAGASTVLTSICEADFQRLLDGILTHVATRAGGSCE